jgi:hypothetical protein
MKKFVDNMNSREPKNGAKSMNMQDAKQSHPNLFAVLVTFDLLQRESNNDFKTFYDSSI